MSNKNKIALISLSIAMIATFIFFRMNGIQELKSDELENAQKLLEGKKKEKDVLQKQFEELEQAIIDDKEKREENRDHTIKIDPIATETTGGVAGYGSNVNDSGFSEN